jgi:hypothetical protein
MWCLRFHFGSDEVEETLSSLQFAQSFFKKKARSAWPRARLDEDWRGLWQRESVPGWVRAATNKRRERESAFAYPSA